MSSFFAISSLDRLVKFDAILAFLIGSHVWIRSAPRLSLTLSGLNIWEKVNSWERLIEVKKSYQKLIKCNKLHYSDKVAEIVTLFIVF